MSRVFVAFFAVFVYFVLEIRNNGAVKCDAIFVSAYLAKQTRQTETENHGNERSPKWRIE
jgi:hypothetical protein